MTATIQATTIPGTGLSLHVEPWGPTAEQIRDHSAMLLRHPSIAERMQGKTFGSYSVVC